MDVNDLGRNVAEVVKIINTTLEVRYLPAIEHQRQHLETGRAQLEHLLDTLETALNAADQQTQQHLADWEHGLEAASQHVASIAEEVHGKIEQAEHQVSQFKESLHQLSEQFHQHHQQITQQFTESASHTQHAHDQTVASLHQWVTETDSGLEKLGQQHATIESELTALQQQGVQHFNTLGQTYHDLSSQTGHHLSSLEQHLDTSLQKMLEEFEQLWQRDIDSALTANAGQLTSILDQFSAAGDQFSTQFVDNTGQILDKVQQVAALLEKIKPIIDLADQLV